MKTNVNAKYKKNDVILQNNTFKTEDLLVVGIVLFASILQQRDGWKMDNT